MTAFVRRISILSAALAAVASGPARALEIDYQSDPNRHNRFLSGFGTNPVQNTNVLGIPGLGNSDEIHMWPITPFSNTSWAMTL